MRSPIGFDESNRILTLFQPEFVRAVLVYAVCFMRRMVPVRVFLLVFAVVLAAEPVVHNHPLLSASNSAGAVCAVCASGIGRIPAAMPAVVAPEIVVTTIITPDVVEPAVVTPTPRASRAPPTA
jgi:hypothetical protein